MTEANPFDQFDEADERPSFGERARLHALSSYYTGTLGGAAGQAAAAYAERNAPDLMRRSQEEAESYRNVDPTPMEGESPLQAQTRARAAQRRAERGVEVQSTPERQAATRRELAAFEAMPAASGVLENAAAVVGAIGGAFPSPESMVMRVPGMGALAERIAPAAGQTALQIAEAALSQAAVNAATDPVVQGLNIAGDVRRSYDPVQTALSPFIGAAVGGGMTAAGPIARSIGRRVDQYLDPMGPIEAPTGFERSVVTPFREDPRAVFLDDPLTLRPGDVARPIKGDVPPTPLADSLGPSPRPDAPSTSIPEGSPSATAAEALPSISNDNAPAPPRAAGMQFRMEPASGGDGAGIRTTDPTSGASPAADPVRSLQQQAFDLADALGHPLRQGRLAKSQALGQYDTAQGVARVRRVADFETVSHESGHYLEQKIGPELRTVIDRYAGELGPMDYDASRGNVSEGFAEFSRLYLTNPAAAKAQAPQFYGAFRDFMAAKHGETLGTLDRAQTAYAAWINAPSGERMAAVVVRRETDGIVSRIRENGLAATVRMGLSEAYTATIDDKSPVTRMVRDMARAIRQQTGDVFDLKHAHNPDVLLRLAERSHQAAQFDLQHGVRAYGSIEKGPSLYSAIALAAGDPRFGRWDDAKVKAFSDYLTALRGQVLYDRFEAGTLRNRPLPLARADLEIHIAEAEAANPTWRAAADQVHAFTRALLRKQFDAGLIKRDLFDKLMEERFYVPLFRDVSDKPMAEAGSGAGRRSGPEGPGMVDTIRRIQGSDRDVIDPIQGLMTQAFLVNRTIAHNDAVRAAVRLAEQAGPAAGRWVERVPAHEMKGKTFDVAEGLRAAGKKHGIDPDDMEVLTGALTDMFGEDPIMATIYRAEAAGRRGEPLVFYREGGDMKAVRFAASKEGLALYESFAQLPNVASDLIVQIIGAGTSVLRSGVTANPAFAVTNFIRDQMTVFVFRPDFMPFLDGLRGAGKEVRQADSALLYAASGGVTPGAAVGAVDKIIEGEVNALAKKGYLVNRLTSFRGLLELAGVTETGTRIAVYDRVFAREIAAGRSPAEAMIAASWEATDVADFSRHGSKLGVWTRLVPFMRASIVGLDKTRRVMVEPILQAARGDVNTTQDEMAVRNAFLAWMKAGAAFPVFGFFWAWMFGERDAYRDADPTLKATHFVLPTGNGRVTVAPKPFEVGLGFNIGEEAYARFIASDPRAADRLTEALAEQLLQPFNPGRMLMGIPGVKTAFEIGLNRNAFTNRDIVPESQKNLPKDAQVLDNTSPLAKAIAKTVNRTLGAFSEKGVISPLQVDHIAGSMFGLYGRDLMAASKMVESKLDETATPGWEDTIAARRFFKSEMTARDTSREFWKYAASQTGSLAGAKAHYDGLVGRFRDDEARAYLNTLDGSHRAFVVLSSAADATGRAAFSADERRLHPVVRGAEASRILMGLAGDLKFNRQTEKLTGERMAVPPDVRGQLVPQIRTLAIMEHQRTSTLLGVKGYADRKLPPVAEQMEIIRAIHPGVADEITQRYAQGKVYRFDAVARIWGEVRNRLSADGGSAFLRDLQAEAVSEGFEFEGVRMRQRQQRRRLEIPGAAAP